MPGETLTADDVARSIATAGTAEFKPIDASVVAAPQKEVAAPVANAEKPATESQPTDKGTAEQKTEGEPEKAKAEGTAKAEEVKTDAQPTAEEKAAAEKAKRERLGLSQVEPDTAETLKTKYESSSKEAHRLISERKAIDQVLKESGVELIQTREGKLALKANKDYLSSIKDEDVPDIFSGLSAGEKELVDEEVTKKIVRSTMEAVLAKKPVAKATDADKVIPDNVVSNMIFNDLAKQKLSDGSPRFEGIESETTLEDMRALYDDPANEAFRSFANQSESNMKTALSLLHAAVFRANAPYKAKAEAAQKEKAETKEKIKKDAPTATEGSGVAPDVLRTKRGSANLAEDIARKIASATPS